MINENTKNSCYCVSYLYYEHSINKFDSLLYIIFLVCFVKRLIKNEQKQLKIQNNSKNRTGGAWCNLLSIVSNKRKKIISSTQKSNLFIQTMQRFLIFLSSQTSSSQHNKSFIVKWSWVIKWSLFLAFNLICITG